MASRILSTSMRLGARGTRAPQRHFSTTLRGLDAAPVAPAAVPVKRPVGAFRGGYVYSSNFISSPAFLQMEYSGAAQDVRRKTLDKEQ
jgi:hypothetical protein